MEIYEIAVALWLDGNDSSICIRTDWKSASFTGLGLQAHFFIDSFHFTVNLCI